MVGHQVTASPLRLLGLAEVAKGAEGFQEEATDVSKDARQLLATPRCLRAAALVGARFMQLHAVGAAWFGRPPPGFWRGFEHKEVAVVWSMFCETKEL